MHEALNEESLDTHVLTDLTQSSEDTIDAEQLAIDLLKNAVATTVHAPESEPTV